MPNVYAIAAMIGWTIVAVLGMNALGVAEHFREPLWAAGAAVLLLITLMVNVWIFFKVAGDHPWKWIK